MKKRVAEMSKRAQKSFLVTNNHPRGQAAVNALQLKSLLTGKRVLAPELLVKHYPQLEEYVEPEKDSLPQQQKLA